MAVPYIELVRALPLGEPLPVDSGGTLLFDTVVAGEGLGSQIDYDMGSGLITFLEAGFYCVDWFVAPQFGLTTGGSNWAVQTSLSGLSVVGSSHTKVSATIGFALLNAGAGETARLVNVSDGAIYLSQAVQSKAGLIV